MYRINLEFMAQHNQLGDLGERIAANYLIQNGYEILEKNWRFKKAEIDLIIQKDDMLAAVEVKTRSSLEFGNPEEFVGHKKIKLLIEAFDYYIESKGLDMRARFDIIAIYFDGKQYKIEHIEDAFLFF